MRAETGRFRIWKGFVSALIAVSAATPLYSASLSKDDTEYLQKVARDTYRCIENMTDPKTGLPYDHSKIERENHTSVTNIGFYLASVAGAMQMGIEGKYSGIGKIKKVLNTLLKFQTWKNFPTNWTDTSNLTRHPENFVSTVDLGNLYAGIIVIRQAFPEFQEICDKILAVNWKYLYDPRRKFLYGGYDVTKEKYTDWYYDNLGADSRMASFLAMAMSKVPKESWDELHRTLEERYGCTYLKPGWDAGGLFLGYMTGIFIDERGTLPGISAANFAKAQILHKQKTDAPVWGWAASDSPQDGYLGFLKLKDEIVAPYASILAVQDFPKEVVNNLRILEDLGVRAPHLLNGKYVNFGYRDAYDIRRRQVTQNYLMLDQTMIFLTLVNCLSDRYISKTFESYPPVRETKALLSDYVTTEKSENLTYPVDLGKHFNLKVVPYDLKRPEYAVQRSSDIPLLNEQEWERCEILNLSAVNVEAGKISNEKDLGADVSFLWDTTYLYVRVKVRDQSLQIQPNASEAYKGDLVEIYVNPDSQGLVWGNVRDFQIGITPPFEDGEFQSYLWFQNRPPLYDELRSSSKRTDDGYLISAAITWKLLRMSPPVRGQSLGVSVAVNDIDEGRVENTKINWFFQPREGKFVLGRLIFK